MSENTTATENHAAPVEVHVGVIEWGSDYSDRLPAVALGATYAEARALLAAEAHHFLADVAASNPEAADFLARHGAPSSDPDAVGGWWDVLRLDSDLPVFPTYTTYPLPSALR